MKYFENKLPDGYILAETLDPKSKKGKLIGFIGFLVMALGLTLALVLIGIKNIYNAIQAMDKTKLIITLLVYFVLLFIYIIIHELIHGLFYKIYTRQILKFGMNGKVAYCGVPGIYVYRNAIMVILIAPCVVLATAFLIPTILIHNVVIKFLLSVLLIIQFGGCIYDIYDFFVLLFKYKDPKTLIYDDGPTQKFYLPKKDGEV